MAWGQGGAALGGRAGGPSVLSLFPGGRRSQSSGSAPAPQTPSLTPRCLRGLAALSLSLQGHPGTSSPTARTRVPSKVSELQAVGHGCPDHSRGPKLGQEKHGQREGSPQDGRSHLGDCDRVDGTERRVWRWEAPRGLGPSILAWFSEGGGDQGDKPEAEWGQCNPGPLPAGGGPDNLLCFPGAWFPRLQMR